MRHSPDSSSLCILIPDGGFKQTLKVVRSLARSSLAPSVSVHVCAEDPLPRSLRLSRHVAAIHRLADDLTDEEHVQAVLAIAKRIGADVLFPLSVNERVLFARHQNEVEGQVALVPGSDPETLAITRDKWKLVSFMAAHDIPHPPTIRLEPVSTLPERLQTVPFPVVVKTTIGANGVHIFRFEEPSEVLRFAETKGETWREYMVQSYIEGSDIDYSVLAVDGYVLAYTIQQGMVPSEHEGFGPPSLIEFVHDPLVEAVGHKLVRDLGLTGLAHMDLRYDTERASVYVLEINTRIWGSVLGSLRAGVNFSDLACRVALERPISKVPYDEIQYAVGEPSLERVREALRHGISLRRSCMSFGVDDPLPDLLHLYRTNREWLSTYWGGEEDQAESSAAGGQTPRRQDRGDEHLQSLKPAAEEAADPSVVHSP
jgi:glutathione synthase/RimK-type ligase-like ATP-grasp enzyme